MVFGVAYYPEHWPIDRWAIDARQMAELGLQVVRLAEFAWSKIEPQEGRYDWDWLDQVIETFSQAGLHIVLGTPTAAPPAWLARAHPDILPVNEAGHVRQFGSRRHYCPSSPTYHAYTRRMVNAMAARYAPHPAVIGWQIDNEFGDEHTARCYCDHCAAAFRNWLAERYRTIEALNQAWGTVFWSQDYSDWSQILPPNQTVTTPNPSHVLDYYRFSSHAYQVYQQQQIDLLRAATSDNAARLPGQKQFITHNFMGLFQDLDQFQLAQDLDFASWDSYPIGNADRWRALLYPADAHGSSSGQPHTSQPAFAADAGDPYITGMAHDLTRGLKNAPFWVMEQQCGHINWGAYNQTIRRGITRLWTWHALASGASAVIYFRWRACRYAQEQYHSGLLGHDASPGVGYHDLQVLASEQAQLDEIANAPWSANVALLCDFEDLWALQIQPHRKDFAYLQHLFVFYKALQRLGVNVDLRHPQDDLSPYRLVLAPTLHLVSERLQQNLERTVRQGGNLLLGIRSGFKTSTNLVSEGPLPGRLAGLAGVHVAEWGSLAPGMHCTLASHLPGLANEPVSIWAERLEIQDEGKVKTLAHYLEGPLAGGIALAAHSFGQGLVFSLGFYPTPGQAVALLEHLTAQLDIPHLPALPEGVLAIARGQKRVLLNFTDHPFTLHLEGNSFHLPAREVQVIPARP